MRKFKFLRGLLIVKKLTNRDKKMINFIHNTNMIFTIRQIADIFYRTGNDESSYVVASRRLRVVREFGYLKMTDKVMGESSIYYRDKLPKEPKHKLLMSEFLRMLSISGFTIVDVQTEYQGFREYSLVPDMRVIMEYNDERYVVFVEVDLTKGFTSEEKYYQVFKNMKNLKEQIPYKVLLVSVCDKPFATNYVNPIRLKTDFSDWNRLIWKFVK